MHSYSLPNCNLYLLLVLSIFFGSIFLSCLCNLTIVESTRHIFRSWSTHYPKHNVSLIYFLFIWIFTSSSLHHICFPAVLVSPCRWLISHYVCCSWNATYESLLGTRQPFPKPIPLSVSAVYIYGSLLGFLRWECKNYKLIIWFSKNRKWLNSWWMFGSVKGCMVETW